MVTFKRILLSQSLNQQQEMHCLPDSRGSQHQRLQLYAEVSHYFKLILTSAPHFGMLSQLTGYEHSFITFPITMKRRASYHHFDFIAQKILTLTVM